jgi:hypothetical protein
MSLFFHHDPGGPILVGSSGLVDLVDLVAIGLLGLVNQVALRASSME